MIDWPAIQGAAAVGALIICGLGQLILSVKRTATVQQKLANTEAVVGRHESLVEKATAQRADHERRIGELESDMVPLKATRDQFNELKGQGRAEHLAQNKILDEIKAQIRDVADTLGNRLDGVQHQLNNIVMGSANTTVELPAHPPRRRAQR